MTTHYDNSWGYHNSYIFMIFLYFPMLGDRRRPRSTLVDRPVGPRDDLAEPFHGHSWQRLQRRRVRRSFRLCHWWCPVNHGGPMGAPGGPHGQSVAMWIASGVFGFAETTDWFYTDYISMIISGIKISQDFLNRASWHQLTSGSLVHPSELVVDNPLYTTGLYARYVRIWLLLTY